MDGIDKKKKRNKKKKYKQTQTADDVAAGADQSGDKLTDLDSESQNDDFDRHQPNATEISVLTEAEKQQWLHREAILKGTIRQLQHDNDSHIQKEAILEEKVKLLQVQNDSELQKQASLEQIINQLRHTNYLSSQKEVTLKETIQQLRIEIDIHIQKEDGLEKKIVQLQSEKESCLRKEAVLEEKLQNVVNEKTLLDVKLANSEQKIKLLESARGYSSLKEVSELEESRKNLMKENQQLMENMSALQLQLQNLEPSITCTSTSVDLKKHASELEEKDSEIEAACALVDKLITENAELIEKVNELYVKLDRQRSAGVGSKNDAETSSESFVVHRKSEDLEVAEEEVDSGPIVHIPLDNHRPIMMLQADEDDDKLHHKSEDLEVVKEVGSRAIVHIPLEDHPPVDEDDDKMTGVPLSDAPFTGAPLRLISLFAKYVSGADLVTQN